MKWRRYKTIIRRIWISTNSPAITGDGIKMVKAVGGDLVDMTEIQTT